MPDVHGLERPRDEGRLRYGAAEGFGMRVLFAGLLGAFVSVALAQAWHVEENATGQARTEAAFASLQVDPDGYSTENGLLALGCGPDGSYVLYVYFLGGFKDGWVPFWWRFGSHDFQEDSVYMTRLDSSNSMVMLQKESVARFVRNAKSGGSLVAVARDSSGFPHMLTFRTNVGSSFGAVLDSLPCLSAFKP